MDETNGETAIRVLVADDEAMMRAGIRAILTSVPGFEVVGEAADGREAVALVAELAPDVALIDVQMPGTDGLAATETITAEHPGTAVVVLTTFSEDTYIARALSGGAAGFVLKSGDPHQLVAGLRAVVAGGAYLSPEVARRVSHELDGGRLTRAAAAREKVETLSGRERDVLALLGEGCSNDQVARRLHIAPGTAKVHVRSILTRLDLENRVQAAVLAYEAGLAHRY
ncbi:response regulator transcription factor [Nocardiopsis sp. HNM0947]|uniref:Response regulator transcription factor n=1 Tax=Nocardiopsis coralli TaxID=2772213 RepID=A0ABR9P9C0_9ACTN|nr:response regulator transcription factor [Nocardiopsis coralli]MBE3000428.1 response regulator transcription factor [Nocardiopsis coralli]